MTCICGTPMLPVRKTAGSPVIEGYVCSRCGEEVGGSEDVTQPKLPGIDPGPAQKTMRVPEADVQAKIVNHLRFAGHTVLVTSRRRKMLRYKCSSCGKVQAPKVQCDQCHASQYAWQHGGDGCDAGIPDLLVSPRQGDPRWVGLEVKGGRTAKSAEQAKLESEGRIVVVRSVDQADAALRGYL